MGFFSNLIKKVGKFIVSVFRDVEPVIEEPILVTNRLPQTSHILLIVFHRMGNKVSFLHNQND